MQRDVGCSGMQQDGGTPLPDTPTAPEPHSYGVTVCGAAAGALCMDGFGGFFSSSSSPTRALKAFGERMFSIRGGYLEGNDFVLPSG